MVIWKYQFEIDDVVTLHIPATHVVLSIQNQDGFPTLWAMVDPQSEKVMETLYVYGTGHPIKPANKNHIGTIQIDGLVWHIFTKTKA